ncbi:uncharacterized protein LOC110030111 isoform X2 [Phalaenopsis equestris]|uniref:uncharacterized protein LOC110030111 isoform X2 n=1 Tax=Phalaenopsis equestris TaxID=78828 RepID=UPI0009E30052|nr:uncharacterized protein LOC110030111 isoform X2 [Phalaenopsis equestris]
MGKKAQRRSSIPERDNASWIQSFVSIFEFSQSYNLRKLLTDRKRRSARNRTHYSGNNLTEDTLDRKYEHDRGFDGCKDTMVLSRLPSVKSLIEEEMSVEKTSMASVWNIKSNQKMFKNHKNDSDPRFSHLMGSAYDGSNLILDLAALMTEFYSVSRNCSNLFEEIGFDLFGPFRSNAHKKYANFDESDSQLAYKNSMLLEALVDEAEAFLSQKIDETKQLVGNGVIHSQEFMDALEILNSNKELFLKLVQHPNSIVFGHIQQLLKPHVADSSKLEALHYLEGSDHSKEKNEISDQNGRNFTNQMFQKQKKHFFLKKKDKFHEETASKIRNSSKERSKIVVLTPHIPMNNDDSIQNSPCSSPQSCYSKKHEKSLFSFKEIRRRLKYIISDSRKEQHLISKKSFCRIPVACKGSANEYSMKSEEGNRKKVTTQAVPSNSKAKSITNSKEWQQNVETEATQCKIQGLSPVSLFHAESFNEESEKYFSEMISTDYSTAKSTNNQNSNPLEELISPSDCNLLIDDSSSNLRPEQCSEEETYDGEQPNTEGREEIVDVEKEKYVHINSAACNNLYIPDGCSSCESCTGACSEQGTPNEKPRMLISPASISPNSLIIKHVEPSEFIVEKPERASPISVLEPFFLEDGTSPDCPSIKLDSFTTDELHKPLQPIHLNFHEDSEVVITPSNRLISHQRICSYDMEMMTKFVRTVLESYNFDSEMSLESLPSLSDEIRSLQSSYPEDPKLLLDCVNEVLSEIKVRRFQIFSSLLSLLKPTTLQPFLKDFIINEVSKTIKSYAVISQVQSTINEIVRKDMGSTMWMDYRLGMEHIIAEVCCYISEELLEETICQLFF